MLITEVVFGYWRCCRLRRRCCMGVAALKFCISGGLADHRTIGRLRGFWRAKAIGDRTDSYLPDLTELLVTRSKVGVEEVGEFVKTSSSESVYWKLSSVGVYSLLSFRGSVNSNCAPDSSHDKDDCVSMVLAEVSKCLCRERLSVEVIDVTDKGEDGGLTCVLLSKKAVFRVSFSSELSSMEP